MSSILFKALLLTKGQGEDDSTKPLTLTANTAGSTVKLTQTGSPTVSGLQYRTSSNNTWTAYSTGTTITLENEGDYVQFQNSASSLSTAEGSRVQFVMTGTITGSGNMQSMVNWIDSAPDFCFYYMFADCTSLINIENLLFSAITVGLRSYHDMFARCKNLVYGPTTFSAKTVGEHACWGMFVNCSSIVKGPSLLPATTLGYQCYGGMFNSCTSLTTAPELPATTLENLCYKEMFQYCTSLTTAPELPATTLKSYCYQNMFYNCTSLNYIKVAFTSWSTSYTSNWVYNVASTGTFVKPAALSTARGNSYIPSNWTVEIDNPEFIEINDQSISWNPNNTAIQLTGSNVTTWTATDLPTGLTLDSSTGKITGTPTVYDGTYTFTVVGTNPNGYTAQATITITIDKLTAENQVISQYYDDPVNYSIKYSISSSSLNPTFTIVEGSLPTGLTLDQNTGVISGTATTTFTGDIQIQISAEGCESVTFTVSINLHTQNNPLTLTANTAGSTVQLTKNGSPTVSGLQYRTSSNNTWTAYTIAETITLENKGDFVQFQNTEETLSTSTSDYVYFVMTGSITGSGNIQSMLNWIENAPAYCYYQLFRNCNALVSIEDIDLSATTLSNNCYMRLFNGCTSLTTATKLTATTLAVGCYSDMFWNCTSLTSAPELPATTLTNYCYSWMFYGCTSLTTAPELPATTLASYCYNEMFAGCTSLTSAPELPAETLVYGCYNNLFNGCKKLNYIKVGFTSWDSTYTSMWVNGVASTGTFEAPRELPIEFGNSRMPTNWDLPNHTYIILTEDQEIKQNYQEAVDYTIQYTLVPDTLQPTFTIIEGELPEGLTLDPNTGVITGTSTTEFIGDVKIQISCEGCESVIITLSLTLHNYQETENNLTANDSNEKYTVSQRTTSGSYYAWKAMDGNSSTYSKTRYASGQYDWWQIDFHQPVFLGGFTLTCNNESTYGTYLEASEDGSTWTRIDSTKIPDNTTTTREYEFTTPYQYYRFINERTYYYVQFYEIKLQYQYAENIIIVDNQEIKQNYQEAVDYTIQYTLLPDTLQPTFTIVEGSLPDGLTLDQNTGVISGTATTTFEGTVTIQISAEGCESVTFTVSINLHTQNNPLTLTANTAGSTVQLASKGTITLNGLQYRLGASGGWSSYSIGTIITLENEGDFVQFQNTEETLSTSESNYVYFIMTGTITASGNIQSMLNWIDTVHDYCFNWLFSYNQSLINIDDLHLPAITLATQCYSDMFQGCASLKRGPKLYATNLAHRCYSGFFKNCYNLQIAPELAATTLASYCYNYMFQSCTSLTSAPELPATTLADRCYRGMFYKCTSLNYIKVAFTTWNTDYTPGWVNSVASTGTFVKPTALSEQYGIDYIPSNWTVENY